MTATIALEGKLDLSVVADLYAKVSAAGTGAVAIDMQKVTHLGALALQVLIAAGREKDRTLTLTNTSDRVLAQMAAMGTTPETIAEAH